MSLRKLCYALIIAFLPLHAAAVTPYELADKACQQQDEFVAFAIIEQVKKLHPDQSLEIDRYVEAGCSHEEQEAITEADMAESTEKAAEIAAEEEAEKSRIMALLFPDFASRWWGAQELEGEVDAGFNLQTGNVEQEDINAALALRHTVERLRSTLKASAFTQSSRDITIAEEYRAQLRNDLKLDETWFLFGEVDYVKDRFSGFDYRLSELLGVGAVLYNEEDFAWEARAGVGARHDQITNGMRENSLLFKTDTEVRWDFYDDWSLSQIGSAAITNQNGIYESTTALQSSITDALSIKAAYFYQFVDSPPLDARAENTRTTLGLSYGF